MTAAERWIIRGRVQGVGFRDWLVGEARRYGVVGWCRNRTDGTVEAFVAAARQDTLDRLEASSRLGPASAEVSAIDRMLVEIPSGLPARFERR